MNNTSYIYQPHFKTKCFRVACTEQTGPEYNFIVVTCSPQYNGVWFYPSYKRFNYEVWHNKTCPCYCVPIKDCTFIKSLNNLTNPNVIKMVKKMQTKWFKSDVLNRDYNYKNKPEWMLK